MEKQKKWQLYLILGVILLTVYNILPTVFYYSNPLKKPISSKEAHEVAQSIAHRVNDLETFTLSWIKAQTKNLGLKPLKITLDKENPRVAAVTFRKHEDALLFANTLRRAGALIPFTPAELAPPPEVNDNTVYVQRNIGIHFDPEKLSTYFHYAPKTTDKGTVSPEYQELVNDRVVSLALSLGGESKAGKVVAAIAQNRGNEEETIRLARTIVEYENTFGDESPITKKYFASFTQVATSETPRDLVHKLSAELEKIGKKLNLEISSIKDEQKKLSDQGQFLGSAEQQRSELLLSQKNVVDAAAAIVRRNNSAFEKGLTPLTRKEILQQLNSSSAQLNKIQVLDLQNRNPFVEKLEIDWDKETVQITLNPEIAKLKSDYTNLAKTELAAIQMEKLNQLLFSEIAAASRDADETITPLHTNFVVSLNKLTNSSSLLTMDIPAIASLQIKTLQQYLDSSWMPTEKELVRSAYPIWSYDEFTKLTGQEQKFGLLLFAPATLDNPPKGFRNGSIYVIGRGLNAIKEKYEGLANSPEKEKFEKDFRLLHNLLGQNGFIAYPAKSAGLPAAYQNDYIFELDDYYSYLLAATREDFSVKGSKKFAFLEFTDVEQRLLTRNKIDTRIHEDLVKWRDEYRAARVNINPAMRFDVPKPTKSVFLSNLKLSFVKYFRGDDRKILKWGLDLSGGKTIRIGLTDSNNNPIVDEADLKEAMNELYRRVNKLGLSEVSIRAEGPSIVLDFPGSQGLTASDLIQASAMYFHIVNEKFTPNNPLLAEAVNGFLDAVWNEAVITNRTDPESLNDIAWQNLGGNLENPDEFHPLSKDAQILYQNGLRLASSKASSRSSRFDDSLSMISLFRGSDFSEWQGQTNPLLIVFRNYSLEGANLSDVQTSYDPSEGNVLQFAVKGSYANKEGERINPRDDFYQWTSQFSEEKIAGTEKERFSQGRGWRMAVILNGSIISAPTLNSPLRDSGRITGHFSQREINQLAADLRAGSLSFTPHILSEENISPDLGKEQRVQGILAAICGLALVFVLMISYYRFGGLVASVAVIFNLLILWAVLQNLGAALTLPSIAGIILALGMAVDANVLVFERIREEFALSKRLPSAIKIGYQKAFTAIVDSNLTTIIAALILLNFDSGPIKGLALTLIIGIVSSMFTSLFVTRYFFMKWVQNPAHKELKMAQLFTNPRINFLSKAKLAIVTSIVLVAIGAFFLVAERKTIFGMDFTGGYALTLNLTETPEDNYRLRAEEILNKAGALSSDFQIRELNKPNQLRIQFGMSMEQPGKPFYQLEKVSARTESYLFLFQENPRIRWIVDTLEKGGLEVTPSSLATLHLQWTEMSGQLSSTMRNQALIGLVLALICILIYITFRFEFKYAISATIGLAHDLLITLGVLAICHIFYEGIRIDLQVIAALMTIVGYSLNDTIIIFDRIREESKIMRKQSFYEIVNHALNATLSRTIMTSGTTVAVLLALMLFGGSSIFNFAFIMTVGVAIGTISSLFIASPLLLYFHQITEKRGQRDGYKTRVN